MATGLTPSNYQPHPQPLSKGRGEWYALLRWCILVCWLFLVGDGLFAFLGVSTPLCVRK